MNELFNEITKSFGALWHYKILGNTMEIITPMSTTNDCFVSVFVTERDSNYIVTDGGWISEHFYNNIIEDNDDNYNRLFMYYVEQYSIMNVEGKGRTFYYKSTNNRLLVPNLVYDVATFVTNVVSSSFIQFKDPKNIESQKRFSKEVNNLVSSIVDKKDLHINGYVDEKLNNIKFNAVVVRNSRFILLNYVTGSNETYFIGSIGKSNMNFQLINNSSLSYLIHKRVTIINDKAPGYTNNKINKYIDLIPKEADSDVLMWSGKKRLHELVE